MGERIEGGRSSPMLPITLQRRTVQRLRLPERAAGVARGGSAAYLS